MQVELAAHGLTHHRAVRCQAMHGPVFDEQANKKVAASFLYQLFLYGLREVVQ